MNGQKELLNLADREEFFVRVFNFFSLYKKQLFYALFSFIILFVVLLGRAVMASDPPFFKVERDMQKFQQEVLSGIFSQESLDPLNENFGAYPSLAAKYKGKVSQLLMALGKGKEKKNFLQSSVETLHLPALVPYQRFSEIALIIEQKDWQQALRRTQAFDQEFRSLDDPYLQPLIFLNALYASVLLDQLSLDSQSAWERVQSLSETFDRDELNAFFFFDELKRLLSEGEFSYQQFLGV